VFTPLLASTAVGTLEFRTACEPIRSLRSRHSKVEFFQGWADTADFAAKTLSIEETAEDDWPPQKVGKTDNSKKQQRSKMFEMSYDKLVVSVGCYSQTFDTPGVKENAYFLKDISDASKIRNRLLSCKQNSLML
jgi:NADH dehydrogenase FAD-containing subunit